MEVFKIKNFRYSLFIVGLAVFLCLEFYNPTNFDKVFTENEYIESNIDNTKSENNETQFEFDEPEISGVIENLPWTNDEDFLKAQRENETNVLMAAYCTVLKDPLPGEEYNVHLAASSLAGTVVLPEQVFSQNNTIGPYIEGKGYRKGPTYIGANVTTTVGGGVCKISSTLYNVSVLSNLEIVERYNHTMPVPYVPYGQDATVAYGVKDFKFKNNTDFPILIWAKGIENRLYMGVYGREEPPEVEWNHNIQNVIEAPKYYKKNPELEEGEEKIIVEGMDGAMVESWVTITDKDGTVKTKELGTSRYIPMPYIIETNE
jgi:vancomycin resistance protein YoaR